MILTYYRRINDARRLKEQNGGNSWLLIGGTEPWPDDDHPPVPALSLTSIAGDVVGAAKATIRWVKEDPAGTIGYLDKDGIPLTFSEITTDVALLANVDTVPTAGVIVMFEGIVIYSLLSCTSFRKLGFCTNLVPASGHSGDTYLDVSNIADLGQLETIEYVPPFVVIPGTKLTWRNIVDY